MNLEIHIIKTSIYIGQKRVKHTIKSKTIMARTIKMIVEAHKLKPIEIMNYHNIPNNILKKLVCSF
jgi:hypothetical protein